jgi:hypothetical protein
MKWLHPSMSPLGSVAMDVAAGCLTGLSIYGIVTTSSLWPHGMCATGVNDPIVFAFALIPFGIRCLLVKSLTRPPAAAPRGFEVIQSQHIRP